MTFEIHIKDAGAIIRVNPGFSGSIIDLPSSLQTYGLKKDWFDSFMVREN